MELPATSSIAFDTEGSLPLANGQKGSEDLMKYESGCRVARQGKHVAFSICAMVILGPGWSGAQVA